MNEPRTEAGRLRAALTELLDALTDDVGPGHGSIMSSVHFYIGRSARTATSRGHHKAVDRLVAARDKARAILKEMRSNSEAG